TINIMNLSGVEIQEMFDFVADRSAERGCVSQAQLSGARFTMDCAQVQLNDLRVPCTPARNGADCPQEGREGHAPWQCLQDQDGNRCWAHPAIDISINGQPINPNGMYRVAVNDYIAKGGSGFSVLKRNTTRQETGISLRDSLIGYMQGFCTCDDILAGRATSKTGARCATTQQDGKWVVDEQTRNFCTQTQVFEDLLALRDAPQRCNKPGLTLENIRTTCATDTQVGTCSCGEFLDESTGQFRNVPTDVVERCPNIPLPELLTKCAAMPSGPYTGRCTCREALKGAQECGSVTRQLKSFCENPTAMPIANATEDGRIGRKVK
ncbi:MAG TPA: 5'-nucleotidase C-terminal domain-containing protein, partial [Archangium sp.]|uniref:5'-nucleotidase C-terminal domain-containing protein n=1 Tax=Archangium sp. TaxID=1872627 RepID=UPI002ED8E465